jgi:hypothetical protein
MTDVRDARFARDLLLVDFFMIRGAGSVHSSAAMTDVHAALALAS